MRIVIDARESGTSTGRYIDKLIEYLAKEPGAYSFIVVTRPDQVDFLKKLAPKMKVVAADFKDFTFAEQFKLLKLLKELQPDLVHFGMVQQPVLYRGPAITTIHDLTTARFRNPAKNWLVFTVKQQVYRWVIRVAARKSRAIITPSQFVKEDVARFTQVNSRKITVTYEAADVIAEKPDPIEELEGKSFIMYVGRPLPHKNLDRLVDAFELLRQNKPDLWLVLAGKKDVHYKKLEKAIKHRGLQHVLFTDFVSEGQLKWLYQNTACYVFPSLSEGFGLPGLEAMAHGAPVASSNATCLPEIYGSAAHFFNPDDTHDMSEKIGAVLNDPKLKGHLVQAGKKQAAKYSWQRMANQTLEVYRSVLDER